MNSAARKARDVADDPAAERDEHRRPVDAEIEEPVEQRLELPERLCAFAGRNGDRIPPHAEPIESRSETKQVSITDHRIGDHDYPAAGDDGSEHVLSRLQQLLADDDVVSALRQVYADDPAFPVHAVLDLPVCSQLGLGRAVEPVDDILILAESDDRSAGNVTCGGTDEFVDDAMAHDQRVAAGGLACGEKGAGAGEHIGAAFTIGRLEVDRVFKTQASDLRVVGRDRVPARITRKNADIEVDDAFVGPHVALSATKLTRDDGCGLEGPASADSRRCRCPYPAGPPATCARAPPPGPGRAR